jgi:preprotein translocase subunit SecF
MEFIGKETKFDFLGIRKIPIIMSSLLVAGSIVALFVLKLKLGLDFTGGTLVELSYKDSVDTGALRQQLVKGGIDDAVVQHFGTSKDVLVHIPVHSDISSAQLSENLTKILRDAVGEKFVEGKPGQDQRCIINEKTKQIGSCNVQMRRVEFVGPQVGDELTNKGGMALLITLAAVFVYVTFRFISWKFAAGAIIAIIHDVMITFGFFSVLHIEFSLSALAAILAVLGYSLNDTIVVFDRIRENYRRMRKGHSDVEVMNTAINQTLSRTLITSGTTLITVIALFLFGGEIIHSFSIALLVGIVVGTYSSIYVATPIVLELGIQREDLMPVKKEGAGRQDQTYP